MRKTSSIIHKDDSGVTPRPWSGRGRGSLHEGPFTKGQPMSTQAYTESYTAEQTESRIAGRIESHSVGPQTGRTENHSAGIQTERTGSHNAGIQTESSGFPASPNPFPVTVVAISNSPDAKSPPKSHNAETQTICSYFTEPPESRNSPRSPGWTGTTKSRDTQMTEKTLSTSPIHSDTRSIEKIRAETLHAIIQRVIYYSETTVDRPVLIEGQQSLLPNKHSTSFRLYRYGSPLLLLLALTVLVLMMLDISNEKEKWLAANETTRQMAWVMRAGGSYGFPFLSWLFNDAFLEVDAYSYG
ncbi:hypothetical protein MMC30_005961 [Trapelia coarctata]|nr:hypothetical protein [Trapelia coarctata]